MQIEWKHTEATATSILGKSQQAASAAACYAYLWRRKDRQKRPPRYIDVFFQLGFRRRVFKKTENAPVEQFVHQRDVVRPFVPPTNEPA